MPRSPPPAAINASMAALTGSTTTTEQSFDLPLRNYPTPPETVADTNPEDTLPSVSLSTSTRPAPVPVTPSSVTAEYGDYDRRATPSAAAITESVFQTYNRSRSRSGASSNKGYGGIRPSARSNTPTPSRSPVETRSRSLQPKDLSPTTQALNDKVHRFLRSMSPPTTGAGDELARENRSLLQRIAALQRTERDLINDNQELARRLASNQKRHDTRRQHWKEELVNREKVFEARIRDLEARLARQEEELIRIALDRSRETTLNDTAITSWLATKANTWRDWVNDFAHRDPNRVQSGLHPLQVRELCDGVKDFVRLTDEGNLPQELLTPLQNGVQTARILLQGMLADFITSETLKSPFWVFDVMSVNTLELESPSVPRMNSISPVGFRMDLAMWNFSVAPPRDIRSPRPMLTLASALPQEPQNVRKLPRLVTSIQPPHLSAGAPPDLFNQALPSKQAMEGLYRVLSNGPNGSDNANAWRTSMMKALCEGGMCTEVDSILLNEDARLLAEARLKYAARLKDTFLRSAARFLLQDQDAAGIERLERRLVQEIDAALRFSCQLWCRRDTPQIKGLRDLTDLAFDSSSDDMELCQAQAPLYARPVGRVHREDGPPGYHDGHSIVMVVQPSVGVTMGPEAKMDIKVMKGASKIWAKASVLVASPKRVAAPTDPEAPSTNPTAASPNHAAASPNHAAASPNHAAASTDPVAPPTNPVAASTKHVAAPLEWKFNLKLLEPGEEAKAMHDAASPTAASIEAMVGTPTTPAAPPVPPKDPRETALILLPNIAFKDVPRPLNVVKQSPDVPPPLALVELPKAS